MKKTDRETILAGHGGASALSGSMPGNLDSLSGIGTGGTITGVSRYIKNMKGKAIISVGVEPIASPILTQKLRGEALKPGPQKIQGIGAGFIPDTLDLSVVDRIETVTNEESIETAPGEGRRPSFRHLVRSRNRRGASPGGQSGVQRQDDRRHPAGLRRALPILDFV